VAINVHGNTKFLMPEGEKVGIEELENTITVEDITNFDIQNPQDGEVLIYDAEKTKWINVKPSLPAGTFSPTLQSYFDKGQSGMQVVYWAGEERLMNVSLFGGKAWAEIYFSTDGSYSAPWDDGYLTSDYYITSYRSSFGDVSQLDYSDGLIFHDSEGNPVEQGVTSCLITGEILTNVLFTAKSSKSEGINTSAVLECSHLASTDRAKFTDYFSGAIAGFELLDSFGWGGGAGLYDTHLSYRAGAFRGGEWLIQDSITGTSHGEPRWGYRKSGTDNQGAKAAGQNISPTVVLSVFVTNY